MVSKTFGNCGDCGKLSTNTRHVRDVPGWEAFSGQGFAFLCDACLAVAREKKRDVEIAAGIPQRKRSRPGNPDNLKRAPSGWKRHHEKGLATRRRRQPIRRERRAREVSTLLAEGVTPQDVAEFLTHEKAKLERLRTQLDGTRTPGPRVTRSRPRKQADWSNYFKFSEEFARQWAIVKEMDEFAFIFQKHMHVGKIVRRHKPYRIMRPQWKKGTKDRRVSPRI